MPVELAYRTSGQWNIFPVQKDEITIGRDPHNDLVIDQTTISRTHAATAPR